MSKKPNENKLVVIGHRGARGLAPENTIASIQAALDHKVDMIEIDVHVARDGAIVLNHDEHYIDADGQKVSIYDSTHADIKGHRDDVTSLQEVIEYIDRRVPLIVEIKPGVNADQVCHAIKAYYERGWTMQDIRFCSFSPKILRRIRQHFPEAIIILNHDWSSIIASHNAMRLGTTNIALYHKWLWPPVIRGLSRRGFTLYSFTVDNPKLAAKWHAAGLSGVYTDRPDNYDLR